MTNPAGLDYSAVPGLFGDDERAAFGEFMEKARQRSIKQHGRYGAVYVKSSDLYQAWSAGRHYQMFRAPEVQKRNTAIIEASKQGQEHAEG